MRFMTFFDGCALSGLRYLRLRPFGLALRSLRSWSRFLFSQHETNASDRVNQLERFIEIDFPAEPGDMNIDNVVQRRSAGWLFPDFASQCITQYDLSLMAQQVLEQLELPRCQLDRAAAPRDSARNEIHVEIADTEPERIRWTPAADQRPNAGQQFREREGLDDIVVGAAVQTGD